MYRSWIVIPLSSSFSKAYNAEKNMFSPCVKELWSPSSHPKYLDKTCRKCWFCGGKLCPKMMVKLSTFDIFGVCIHFFLATLFVFKEKVQLQWFGPPWTLLFLSGHQFFKVRWWWNIDFLLCSYDMKQSSGHRMNPCKLTWVMYISRCLPLKVYVSF